MGRGETWLWFLALGTWLCIEWKLVRVAMSTAVIQQTNREAFDKAAEFVLLRYGQFFHLILPQIPWTALVLGEGKINFHTAYIYFLKNGNETTSNILRLFFHKSLYYLEKKCCLLSMFIHKYVVWPIAQT